MRQSLRILLTTLKTVLLLNALFWLVIIAVHVHHMLSGNDWSVPVNVMVLLIGLLSAVSPYVLYFFAHRFFKNRKKIRETSDKQDTAGSRQDLFMQGINSSAGQKILEIYMNKDELWFALIFSLFLTVFGTALFFLGPAGGVLGFFTLLFAVPNSILLIRKAAARTPVLVLTNTGILNKAWPFVTLPYSEIISVTLGSAIGIKVKDQSKFSKVSLMDTLFKADTVSIHTKALAYDPAALAGLITKKIHSPDTPLSEILKDSSSGNYTPNSFPLTRRAFNIVISASVLAYTGYGLITNRLIIPAKGGYVELYGYSAFLMFIAVILLAANLLATVADHYDRRNNEDVYKKIKNYSFRFGWAMYCIALTAAFVQGSQDYVCKNNLLQKAASEDGDMNAFVYERYCAQRDPMKDRSPSLGISVFPSGQGQLPNEPYNTALFSDCRIENIYWDENKLFIEYSRLKNKRPEKVRAELKKNPPVPSTLIEINP